MATTEAEISLSTAATAVTTTMTTLLGLVDSTTEAEISLSTAATAVTTTMTTLLGLVDSTTLSNATVIADTESPIKILQDSITALYLIIMGALIWGMQMGFTFLEAGTMRQKNTANSLTRMFMNGWIAAIMWWLVGYAFAFGTGNGFIGFNPVGKWALGDDSTTDLAFWFFEYTFCAASAAIISGSAAEHVTHVGFILYCAFFTGWIYPVGAHWEWGEDGWLVIGQNYPTSADNPRALKGDNDTFYYKADYQDFAGSGVVHILGAFAGFAALLVLGPRRGLKRSFKEEPADKPTPHSLPLLTLGSMLLTFGFIAFNGGSKLTLHRAGDAVEMSTAVVNTIISGASSALSAIIWHKVFGYFRICGKQRDEDGGKWSLVYAINGSLAGMVAVCAGCNVFYAWASCVVGVIAGLSFVLWNVIITKLRIDDPMDTFAVHAGGGIWGALAVALLKRNGGIVVIVTDEMGTHGNFTSEGWMYFAWQMLGIVTIAGWAFINMLIFLLLLRSVDIVFQKRGSNFRLLRPSGQDQNAGMDQVENNEEAYCGGDYNGGLSNSAGHLGNNLTRASVDISVISKDD